MARLALPSARSSLRSRWHLLVWSLAGALACGRVGYRAHPPDAAAPQDALDATADDRGPDAPRDALDVPPLPDASLDADAPRDALDDLAPDAPDAAADARDADVTTDAPPPVDSGTTAAARDLALGAWSAPRLVVPLTALLGDDDDPTVTADLLELYFNSDRPGGRGNGDIYRSTRASPVAPWGAPTLVAELSTAANESTPEVSPDGLALYFSSSAAGGAGGLDAYVSVRARRGDPWGAPARLATLASSSDEGAPAVHRAGLAALFRSPRPGGAGASDLYVSVRATTAAPWDAPVRVAELSTPAEETSPFVSEDGTLAYFTRNEGGLHVFRSARPSAAGAWGAPTQVAELAGTGRDDDAWVSPDARYLLFVSTRTGRQQIYECTR